MGRGEGRSNSSLSNLASRIGVCVCGGGGDEEGTLKFEISLHKIQYLTHPVVNALCEVKIQR